jgi:hypothetical protein
MPSGNPSQYYFNRHFSDTDKLLVVLLVAFGTVCLLTNFLVFGILIKLRDRGKLPFRDRSYKISFRPKDFSSSSF